MRTMKKRMTMKTLSLLLAILAIPCLGQQSATSTSTGGTKPPSVQACKLTPLSAATEGERIRVGWWSPACKVAKVRVYRRRQHIGEEAEDPSAGRFGHAERLDHRVVLGQRVHRTGHL